MLSQAGISLATIISGVKEIMCLIDAFGGAGYDEDIQHFSEGKSWEHLQAVYMCNLMYLCMSYIPGDSLELFF